MKKLLLLAVVLVSGILLVRDRNSSHVPKPPSEQITIKGSDTEVQLVSNLVEAFLESNPGANISVTGGGSGVGIAALLNKEIDVANSSRALKSEEQDQALAKQLHVQEFILAIDGLTVIVHTDNQVDHLSTEQLGKLYRGEIANWKDVGGKDQPIVLYGRQSTSGTYIFFRDRILKGDYAASMRSMEGSQAIVDAVKADRNAIGYVGVGYVKDVEDKPLAALNILSIAEGAGQPVSPLDPEAVRANIYPIARPIYQYLAQTPQPASLLHQLLTFELSDHGQSIIANSGFYPLGEKEKEHNRGILNAK